MAAGGRRTATREGVRASATRAHDDLRKRTRASTSHSQATKIAARGERAMQLPTPPHSARSTRSASSTDSPIRTRSRRTDFETSLIEESSDDEIDSLTPKRPSKRQRRIEPPTPRATPPHRSRESVPLSTSQPSIQQDVFYEAARPTAVVEGDIVAEPPLSAPEPTPLQARVNARAQPKRKPAVIQAARGETSEEDDDDYPSGDENKPLVQPHFGEAPEYIESHRTPFPAAQALPLLHGVLDVIHGRNDAHVFARATLTSRSDLAAVPSLPCLGDWEVDVRLQLDRTVRDGEGNCMLLLGPRGVGKSAIIDRSIRLLQLAHGTEAFITVRLSGITSTNDRATLREIARQLCTDEGGVEDDGTSFTSHAMILQSLLALLEPEASTAPSSKSLDRNKPVIFVLDEFDLFAERDARQSFLYCLLDIVQSKRRKGGMAVVGVSSRVDCLDRLEKRVRSRCQSRVLRILPPATLADFCTIARTVLTCADNDERLNQMWNEGVAAFVEDADTQRACKDLFDLRACSGELLQNLAAMISQHAYATAGGRTFALPCLSAFQLPIQQAAPERFHLSALPPVCIAVLIAAKHVSASSIKPYFTPAALFDRYERYARSEAGSSQRPFTTPTLTRALEQLNAIDAIVDATAISVTGAITVSAAAQATSSFRRLRMVVWPSELDAVVKARKDLPIHLKQWCKDA